MAENKPATGSPRPKATSRRTSTSAQTSPVQGVFLFRFYLFFKDEMRTLRKSSVVCEQGCPGAEGGMALPSPTLSICRQVLKSIWAQSSLGQLSVRPHCPLCP